MTVLKKSYNFIELRLDIASENTRGCVQYQNLCVFECTLMKRTTPDVASNVEWMQYAHCYSVMNRHS